MYIFGCGGCSANRFRYCQLILGSKAAASTLPRTMNCIHWLCSPCARCCACMDDRQTLLNPRRSALSVSTHDDDWDAEVGFDSKNYSAQLAKARKSTIDREMELQMQHLSHESAVAMHNVAVTDEDEAEILGRSSSNIDVTSGHNANSVSWRGYKPAVLSTEEESYSSGSEKQGNSGQNSPSAAHSSEFGFANRRPYRDTPYSDNVPKATQHSPKGKGSRSGVLGLEAVDVALDSNGHSGRLPSYSSATHAASGNNNLNSATTNVHANDLIKSSQRDEEDDDEEVEISLL